MLLGMLYHHTQNLQNSTNCNKLICQKYINDCKDICTCDQHLCDCCIPCLGCLGNDWDQCCSCFSMCQFNT